MVSCILCLKDISFLKYSIGIHSSEGRELNIFKILTTILNFLQLNSETNKNERICSDCWNTVENFNNFCQRILAAHKSGTALLLIKDDGDANYPISNQNLAKSPDVVNGQNNVFSATNEIKVEVDELDLLPSIEVLCNPVNTNNRNSPSLANQDYIVSSTNANVKPIKFEEHISNDDDSDSDVPLSVYLSHNDDEPIQAIKFTNDTKYEKQKNCEDGQESQNNISYSTNGTIDNGDSNDSWQGDTLKEERYAEIPQRENPPVRLFQANMEKRLAQQKEYDEIIAKFFNKFSCPVCVLLMKDFTDLRSHFRITHDNDSGYMSCCGRKFHTRKLLAEHVLVHWNPEHFKCDTCKRIFQDSRSFESHKNTHKNPESKDKKIYQCDKCPKSFKTKTSFECHSCSKHVPKSEFKFSCKECNKKLPTERKLKDHMKYNHDPERTIICDKCGKQMRSQTHLKNHQLQHSDEPRPEPVPMQCEICSKWFRHLTSLKTHKRRMHYQAYKVHRCHICNKTSPNAGALRYHISYVHERERKFKCTMCKKAFKKPQQLMEHRSSHTGEPLYTCPNCPLTFFSSANMYKHRQRLHRAEWESDRKKPNVNIMKQAMSATAATRLREEAVTEKTD